MSATTTPKKRGRPSTGNAKSSTERSRLLRERSEQIFNIAFHPGRPLEPFADSALLLAFEQSYRKRYEAYVEAIGRELFTRVGISVATTENEESARSLLDAIRAENEGLRAEIAALRSQLAEAKARNTVVATETNSVHATETPALSLGPSAPPPKPKDYPDWLKAKAVAMHKAGESREAITAMLIEAFDKAPDPSNWTKTLRRWEGIGTAGIAGL